MPLIIGIDPGKSGAIAATDGTTVYVRKMPDHEYDVISFIATLKGHGAEAAYLERVRSSPQMGVASAFTFGWGYGVLRAAVIANRLPLHEVLPQQWQRVIGCLTKGDKNVSKRKAQDMFPAIVVTHATADALLIAEYGRMIYSHRTPSRKEGA